MPPYASDAELRLFEAVRHGWTPDHPSEPPSGAVTRKFHEDDKAVRKRKLLSAALRRQRKLDEP